MSNLADNYQQNVHQIGLTIAWSVLLNISIICANLRFSKIASIVHIILGYVILIFTFTFILYFLVPFGFNVNTTLNPVLLYVHAILGCALLGFNILQVAGGIIGKLIQGKVDSSFLLLKRIRGLHKLFGYFLAIVYKIDIFWSWGPGIVFYFLILWQMTLIATLVYLKRYYSKLQQVIVDAQVQNLQIKKISQLSEVNHPYIIFSNNVYNAKQLEQLHPGGRKVIQTIMNREVDRFVYGMYSSQLYPQLQAFSHSMSIFKLIGKPVGLLNIPFTYQGFNSKVVDVKIKNVKNISKITKIYILELTGINTQLTYNGYTDIKQLGQYYSLTSNKITRLYTAVNFSQNQNVQLMSKILKFDINNIFQINFQKRKTNIQAELTKITNNLRQNMIQQTYKNTSYLPIMLKIYDNGKFTSYLNNKQFNPQQLKLSHPKGRGLELANTKPGNIIIVAGGTGLFPFSDLIDLLFKIHLVEQKHEMSQILLKKDPVIGKFNFKQFKFIFLIAIAQPDDIHPLTYQQLVHLSLFYQNIKIVMRVSKNANLLTQKKSKIQFTKEYFTKRVIDQAKNNLSKIWICGPPKLNTDTANNILKNGFSRQQILFI